MLQEADVYISEIEQQAGRMVWKAAAKDTNYLLSRDRNKIGDWCSQGYPHYGGGITYHFKTGKVETEGRVGLFLQDWKAAVVEVTVNRQLAGNIGWKGQDGLDITDFLSAENEIDIKVIATPRNIFGPFHQKYDSCVRSSFKDFRTEGKDYTEEYILEPQGLLKPVTLQKI